MFAIKERLWIISFLHFQHKGPKLSIIVLGSSILPQKNRAPKHGEDKNSSALVEQKRAAIIEGQKLRFQAGQLLQQLLH